jgi:hypothetical protein
MLKTVVNNPLVVILIFNRHFKYKNGSNMSSKIIKKTTKIIFSIQKTIKLNKYEILTLVLRLGMKLAGIRSAERTLNGGAWITISPYS